ncbi:sensor histidine kinase [Haloglycomyces albus]|uniref:sensor histidine kinase n=1 Tax=Haloglycomyces albus TaxID=526067 RepID=UPI00046D8757|nr:sensor histidine kinase [Haloglycomyces albus]
MDDQSETATYWRSRALWLRCPLIVLVLVLGLATTDAVDVLAWTGLLVLAAGPGALIYPNRRLAVFGRFAEVAMILLATWATGPQPAWMLPYLVAPLVFAALNVRPDAAAPRRKWPLESVGLALLAVVGLAIQYQSVLVAERPDYLVVVGVAVAFSFAAAMVGGWLGHAHFTGHKETERPYEEAAALLTQLRVVARQLPGSTLDPGGIASEIVDAAATVPQVDRVAVLAASSGRRMVVLAEKSPDRADWETSPQMNTMMADAWAGQKPQTGHLSLSRSTVGAVSSMVYPLVAEGRTVALVALESDDPLAITPVMVPRVDEVTRGAGLRLETALLFEEVRSMATTEERQRLAREIHDGIAQELAMLGYGIDNALLELPEGADEAASYLEDLRAEVTRLVTELRFSLFELRSNVDRKGGLASAIADFARTVGSSAGLRVHLSLDEGGARLPAGTEAELLRIAQEAITNARKHARAQNLWVTCEVDPPYARVEVTDDGQGLGGEANEGRYGLAIMSERAERIRGSLEIRPREPQGTTVAVVLHASARPGSTNTRPEA